MDSNGFHIDALISRFLVERISHSVTRPARRPSNFISILQFGG